MTRQNSLKVPTMPGGFVIDEAHAPPSQIPMAVPVERPEGWRQSGVYFIRIPKDIAK